MTPTRLDLLRWQLDLTWSLLEYHLERLDRDDVGFEPAALVWTVRPDADGDPTPDWSDTEPDPVPVPTIAWLTWHIGWWWGVALDHAQGRPPRERESVRWPGADAVVPWLRDLRTQWLRVLDGLGEDDLDAAASYPVADDPDYSVGHMIAWVNAELMKNTAEIGQLRLLRAAR
ncbi:DinB family protein [Georgenia faecalis]|uniref:DinB family protein n=1 Tax=Georgenia faecalis TaxID=2483799 RepID=A0ABV9DB96_9MICO|nr:DinB family protein [Georgenia faecalis]